MTTNPRPWPNEARRQRDEAAIQANRGLRALHPVLDNVPMTKEETIRRLAIGIDALQTIARLMETAGAPTRWQ